MPKVDWPIDYNKPGDIEKKTKYTLKTLTVQIGEGFEIPDNAIGISVIERIFCEDMGIGGVIKYYKFVVAYLEEVK